MWTEAIRPKYERKGMRYASDVTDAGWAVISPRLPEPKPLGLPQETGFARLSMLCKRCVTPTLFGLTLRG